MTNGGLLMLKGSSMTTRCLSLRARQILPKLLLTQGHLFSVCLQNITSFWWPCGSKPLAKKSVATLWFASENWIIKPMIAPTTLRECKPSKSCSTLKMFLRSNQKDTLLFKTTSVYSESWSLLRLWKSLRTKKKRFHLKGTSRRRYRRKEPIYSEEFSWETSTLFSTGTKREWNSE